MRVRTEKNGERVKWRDKTRKSMIKFTKADRERPSKSVEESLDKVFGAGLRSWRFSPMGWR